MAIANEVVTDQPCEQLNEDPVKEEIDDDDSSRDSDKTDTQGTFAYYYVRLKSILSDQSFFKTCVT